MELLSNNVSTLQLGKLIGKIFPTFTDTAKVDAPGLSTDLKVGEAYIADPLVHDKMGVQLFLSITENGEWAISNGSKFPTPLLLMHGAADPITSHVATESFSKEIPTGKLTFKLWNGLRHELHNEIRKEEVLQEIKQWLNTLD